MPHLPQPASQIKVSQCFLFDLLSRELKTNCRMRWLGKVKPNKEIPFFLELP